MKFFCVFCLLIKCFGYSCPLPEQNGLAIPSFISFLFSGMFQVFIQLIKRSEIITGTIAAAEPERERPKSHSFPRSSATVIAPFTN